MEYPDGRYARWLEFAGCLLDAPLTRFPVETIAGELLTSLGGSGISWNSRDNSGGIRTLMWPRAQYPQDSVLSAMSESLDTHPLIRWFAATGSPAAQTIGRVPAMVSDARSRAAWSEWSRPFEIDQQLSMPLHLCAAEYRAFVVCRPEHDFSDADIVLARRLQPMLRGLERQANELARWRAAVAPDADDGVADAGLTGRELAVLQLLAEGLPATAISHRLRLQLRTVHKHLEHVYAKLGVHDRLTAVLRAQRLGILG